MEATPTYINVESIKREYQQLTQQCRFIQSLDLIEHVVEFLSKNKQNPEELDDAINKLAHTLNAVAMIHLEAGDYDNCYKLLKRAEGLSIKSLRIKSTTLNNLGCYYRKTNKLSTALMYLQKSLEMQTHAKTSKNVSDTYLNICAVLSSLSNHGDALHSAMMSVIMLQHDLVMTMSDQLKDRIENIVKSDRLSVLALGYYNMAVEFEHLKEEKQARNFYDKAVDVTLNLNYANGKLLNNLQNAKKKFDTSLKRAKHINEAFIHANLKKRETCFQSRVERIRTEMDKDTFYKNLEDNIKKSQVKIDESQQPLHLTDKKPSEYISFRVNNRRSQDWTSKQHHQNCPPIIIRRSKVNCNRRLSLQKPGQSQTTRIQQNSTQLH